MAPIKREAKTQDVMDAMDVSRQTVQTWIKDGCPVTLGKTVNGNRFDLGEVAAWMKSANRTGENGRPPEVVSVDLEAVRIRKEAAMAENWEHRNAIIKGEMVPSSQVQEKWVELIMTAKGKLIGLGANVAPQCVGLDAGEIQTVIEGRVNEVLNELAG